MLGVPTAPFCEEAVATQIADWAKGRGVGISRDPAGNVLLRVRRGSAKRRPRWVFAAHMDHPGFVATRRRGRAVWAEFRGSGVDREYFPGSRVRFFTSAGEVCGTIRSVRKRPPADWLLCRVELDGRSSPSCRDKPAPVGAGTVGMWDLPAMRIVGERIHSRGCDDVVGSAAVVCALDEIVSRKIATDVTALLTRAEEVAFIGALAACRDRSIPRDAKIVAIETSQATALARPGDGVVVRVGDKTRTFDPSLTAHVSAVAKALRRRDRNFRYLRQLMPGGTCESTAYAMFGYSATGLSLPMANYHNCGPNGRIAVEKVHLGDFASLVKLLVALAGEKRTPDDNDARLKRRLNQLLTQRGRYL